MTCVLSPSVNSLFSAGFDFFLIKVKLSAQNVVIMSNNVVIMLYNDFSQNDELFP